MKLKLKTTTRSLIKLHIVKYQIYKNYNKYLFNANSNINNLTIELKQALKIIYLYNLKNKKILFIGFPYNKILHNQLNHFFISKNFYAKKMLTGNFDSSLYKTPDLIVFNNTSDKDLVILNVIKTLNIPLIVFGNSNKLNNKNYNIQGSLKKNKIKNFCFFLIFSVLTRSIKLF